MTMGVRSVLAFCFVSVVFLFFATFGKFSWQSSPTPYFHYAKLAEAFYHGQSHLLDAVDPRLTALKNPYDRSSREGLTYIWDASLYNSKYYLYFTAIPALLVHLPFRALVGVYAPYWLDSFLFSVLLIVVATFICRKFSSLAFIWPIYVWIPVLAFSQPILFSLTTPFVYQSAILAATVAILLGVYCLLCGQGRTPTFYYWAGFFFAAAVTARPHLLPALGVLSLIASRGSHRFSFLSRLALGAFLPLALQGIYNYIRFDSPFEFGMRYQLTLYDLNQAPLCRIGDRWEDVVRIFEAFFYLVANPPILTGYFPYIFVRPNVSVPTHEGVIGMIYIVPLFWVALILTRRPPPRLSVAFFSAALTSLCALSTCTFLAHRYQMETSIFVLLGTVFWLAASPRIVANSRWFALSYLMFAATVFNVLPAFSGSTHEFTRYGNPELIIFLQNLFPRF